MSRRQPSIDPHRFRLSLTGVASEHSQQIPDYPGPDNIYIRREFTASIYSGGYEITRWAGRQKGNSKGPDYPFRQCTVGIVEIV